MTNCYISSVSMMAGDSTEVSTAFGTRRVVTGAPSIQLDVILTGASKEVLEALANGTAQVFVQAPKNKFAPPKGETEQLLAAPSQRDEPISSIETW